MIASYLNGRVVLKVGDITDETTDAIVNAANWTLLGGGGVDGAIHDKGGKRILEACQKIRLSTYPDGLPTGQAVETTAGDLKAKYVIHTVGPIYGQNEGRDAELLTNCYRGSLALASNLGICSIAFPSISTGAFYYPKHEAAKIASGAILQFLESNSAIERTNLVFFDLSDAKIFIRHQLFHS